MQSIRSLGRVKTKAQEDFEDIDEELELTFTCAEQVIKHYRFSIDEEIGSPVKYRELITTLLNAVENDTVTIMFNSGGGRLDSALAIISAIFKSEARVIGHIVGDCYSAAGMIALACHDLHVDEFGTFMVHSATYGLGGAHREITERAAFEETRLNKIFDLVYTGFLTDEELCRVKDGSTYWMHSEEVIERLNKRQEGFESLIFKAEVGKTLESG